MQLSETEQRKIKTTTIHAIIFEQKTPKDDDTSLYQIFERINTSGKTLLPQEIRNCVYQGNLNSLLFKVNKNLFWRQMFGNNSEDSRMRDLEFILRFFALKSDTIRKNTKGNISLKKYLNEFMGNKLNNSEPTLEEFENDFDKCISSIFSQFGENAFFNIQNTDLTTIRKRFYPTIFDSLMIATSIALKNGYVITEGKEAARLQLLRDKDYRKYISEGTMQLEHINGRINLTLKY